MESARPKSRPGGRVGLGVTRGPLVLVLAFTLVKASGEKIFKNTFRVITIYSRKPLIDCNI